MTEDTITLTIDGRELSVPKGTLVIRAAEQLGITIPRFCDHPLLDPVGACRQCIVEVEGLPKPMTSCTTQATDGMVVRTHLASDMARVAQEAQLEFLLINHPLDCPMCDKGGECPLQDQTLAHGPPDSRFIDEKRRYVKPVPISAQIGLDRERCVLCARCTRFSQQISGDPFIELFERGALEQVAIYADEPYHSYFSGNVVQICPVGALTASSYRFKSRPFDLRSADGICNQCSAGCNLRIDTRRGVLQRQLARENAAVNEAWSCDKGRFGFTYVDAPNRLTEPVVRDEVGTPAATSWRQAVGAVADRLGAVVDAHGPDAVAVLTGGHLTDEDNYAVGRFARDVLGTDHVDFRPRPSADEPAVLAAVAGSTTVTYDEVEAADTVVLAGLDPKEEVPILFLRLRKAWRQRRQRIVVVGPTLGISDEIVWQHIETPVGGEAVVLDALASGAGSGLEDVRATLGAGRTVVLAGERLAGSPGALPAAARLASHLDPADPKFAWVGRRAGARGAVDAGLVPGLLPGGRRLAEPGPVAEAWDRLPEAPGLDTEGILTAAAEGRIKALYLIGVDPVSDAADPALARRALDAVDVLIVQDLLSSAVSSHADVVLPAAAPVERVGSFTTWEGRRQPFPQAVPPPGMALEDWDILRQVARALGRDLGWETAMEVRREAAPLMAPAADLADGLAGLPAAPVTLPAPAEGGELDVITVDWLLADQAMLVGADELLATARTPCATVHPDTAAARGLTPGELVALTGPAGRIELPLATSPHVVAGAVEVPANATRPRPAELAPGAARLRLAVAALQPATETEGAG